MGLGLGKWLSSVRAGMLRKMATGILSNGLGRMVVLFTRTRVLGLSGTGTCGALNGQRRTALCETTDSFCVEAKRLENADTYSCSRRLTVMHHK